MRILIAVEVEVADEHVADDFVSGLNYLLPYMGDNVTTRWTEI